MRWEHNLPLCSPKFSHWEEFVDIRCLVSFQVSIVPSLKWTLAGTPFLLSPIGKFEFTHDFLIDAMETFDSLYPPDPSRGTN